MLSTFKCRVIVALQVSHIQRSESHWIGLVAASRAGTHVQFGRMETVVLPVKDELRARIQTGNGNQNLGVLEFLNPDGSLIFYHLGRRSLGTKGRQLKFLRANS
jgi:hypothetical protein